jgi:hypothetical protein
MEVLDGPFQVYLLLSLFTFTENIAQTQKIEQELIETLK